MDDYRLSGADEEEPSSTSVNSFTLHCLESLEMTGEPLAKHEETWRRKHIDSFNISSSIFLPLLRESLVKRELEVTLRNCVINYSPGGSNQALDGIKVVTYGLGEEDAARTEQITPTTWRYHRNIQLHSGMDELVLCVQSEKAVDVGYMAFSKDKLAAFMDIDHSTEMERDFVTLDENGPSLRLAFTLGASQKVDGASEEDTEMPLWFNTLGNSYLTRFSYTNDLADLSKAISNLQKAVHLTPEAHTDIPVRLRSLGIAFQKRFNRAGDLADLASAVSNREMVVNLTHKGHADMPSRLSELGVSLYKRFECTGDLADISNAISSEQRAVDLTPEGHLDMPSRLSTLGTSFQMRFKRTGDLADLKNAISNKQKAIDLVPEGHVKMPSWLNNLGVSFGARFDRTGNLADIATAIAVQQRAVSLTPEGHEDVPSWLSNLGVSFSTRFDHTGDLADISNAISAQRKAVDLTPENHAVMPSLLSNLGTSYSIRFDHTGDPADLSSAITALQRAVSLTPKRSTDMPLMLSNLGSSFQKRFDRTGDLADLTNAIYTQQTAVDLTPEGHPDMPFRLNNLGVSLQTRSKRTGNLADIADAVSAFHRAISLTPEGHTDMASLLNNLGTSLQKRFDLTNDLEDISCSITAQQKAIDITPDRHPAKSLWLNNLAHSFHTRFNRTGDLADVSNAISIQQSAVALMPEGHAYNSNLLLYLARSLFTRFTSTHNVGDIYEALTILRFSATQITGHPSIRLDAARDWALYSGLHDKSQLLDAFSVAIQLLPQVAGLDQTIHQRHQTLINISNITASATATAIEDGKLETALAWLEQGRCLVWNQIHYLRTPAEDLRHYKPSLADRFLNVSRALEVSGSRQERHSTFKEGNMSEMISVQEEAHKHVHLAKEWNELLHEIRAIPEFCDFLQPPQPSKFLSRLPVDGTIVIFNMHTDRCDALALRSGLGYPVHIPLKAFSHQRAIELRDKMSQYLTDHHVRQRQEADRGTFRLRPGGAAAIYMILQELWEGVVKPILDALAYMADYSTQPRIWWCPTGPLAFLPIHAAGIYGQDGAPSGPCVSDFVVSSYASNISALLDKIKKPPTLDIKPTSVLIVSQPFTPGQRPIPGAKREAHALSDMISPPSKSLLLENSSATVIRVKEEMETHNWVHFACHAVQDIAEPLKSGVQLEDGRLEILEMMKQTLPIADLAFLSACQTSTGDEKLADEVVHLAASMLTAGYRSVVATMWSIKDEYGPGIAKDFYEHILAANSADERFDGANAARALHYATQKMRKELGDTEEAFLTWMPYVHFGV